MADYVKKASISYTVSFKCAFCEKDNEFIHSIAVKSSYSDEDVFTKRGLAKREDDAEFRLRDQISKKMDFMNRNIDAQHYSALGADLQVRALRPQTRLGLPE